MSRMGLALFGRVAAGMAVRSMAVGLSLCAVQMTLADDYVSKANAFYADIKPNLRSDLILLPAVAKLQPIPTALRGVVTPELMFAGGQGWSDAVAWATGASQQEALKALQSVTRKSDPREPIAFGLPYGTDGVPIELIRANAFVELGDPPTLAAAQLQYLPMLDTLAALVNIEATRLASEGKVEEATALLVDWVVFGRQMADRQLFKEAKWGFDQMNIGLERIRDVVYTDFRDKKSLSPEALKQLLTRLDDVRGVLTIDRIKFPRADGLASEQVVSRVFVPRKGPDERVFGTTLASIGAAGRPLRLFAEAARWQAAANGHKDQIDTSAMLDRVFGDFASRWRVDFFDRRQLQPYEFGKMSTSDFAVIAATLPDMSPLIELRQRLRVEAVGTRLSLAILGSTYVRKEFPPTVASVRPSWQVELEKDPFNIDSATGKNPMQYFVPIRDTKARFGAKEEPRPHVINVVAGSGRNFAIPIGEDQFIIYSLGSDTRKDWAERVQNTVKKVEGADYLIWPPVISLERQNLRQTGEIK
jgi:hypothetical protein